MEKLNLWFRIVYNKENTPENIDKIRMATEGQEEFIDVVKWNLAELINQMDWLRNDSESNDQRRLCSIAISKLEEACMFCVKACTYDL